MDLKKKDDVTYIELKSLQIFAWEVHEILLMESEFLPLKAFPENYFKRYFHFSLFEFQNIVFIKYEFNKLKKNVMFVM